MSNVISDSNFVHTGMFDEKHMKTETTPYHNTAPSAPPLLEESYDIKKPLTEQDKRGWKATYLKTEGLQLEDAEDRLQRFQQRAVRTQQLQLSSQQNKSAEFMKNMNETDIMSAIYNESDRIMDYVAQIT